MVEAASLAGVTSQVVYVWINRGKQELKGRYRDFLDAIERAKAERQARLIGMLEAIGEGRKFEHPDTRFKPATKKRVRIRKVNGKEVSREEEEEEVGPSAAQIRWMLTKDNPKRFAARLINPDADDEEANAIVQASQEAAEEAGETEELMVFDPEEKMDPTDGEDDQGS